MRELTFTFGEIEALLAELHDIADEKRTAFQARLKNFHRLGFPTHLETQKGKTARYRPGQLTELALALELTQLGMPPERTIRVLTLNWYAVSMAISLAARGLVENPEGFDREEEKDTDPLSMFVFFDPAALSPMMGDYDLRVSPDMDRASDTFFYGGQGVVRENLVKWTSGALNRLSLVNITALLDKLAGNPSPDNGHPFLEWRRSFFDAIADWATERSEKGYATGTLPVDFLFRILETLFNAPKSPAERKRLVAVLEDYFGFETSIIEKAVSDFENETIGRGGA